MRVVICGAGVIGACTAYFLARRGIDVVVVERTEVAAAASAPLGDRPRVECGHTSRGWPRNDIPDAGSDCLPFLHERQMSPLAS